MYPSMAILDKAMGEVWNVIRAEYARRLAAIQEAHEEVTQKQIARLGGVGQNDVSRVLSNNHHGPSVEIFTGAVYGLGMTPSEFFAAIEPQLGRPDDPPPPWVLAALALALPSPMDDYTEEEFAQFGRWAFRSFWLWQASMLAARPKKRR
jgi:transcriptional regulator with XRE-family HTH domain